MCLMVFEFCVGVVFSCRCLCSLLWCSSLSGYCLCRCLRCLFVLVFVCVLVLVFVGVCVLVGDCVIDFVTVGVTVCEGVLVL